MAVLIVLLIGHFLWHLPVPTWLWVTFGILGGLRFLVEFAKLIDN
jgi:hypothetical protein